MAQVRIPGFVANPQDTAVQRRFAFPGSSLTINMISRNIGIEYFSPNNTRKNKFMVIQCYAVGRCRLEGWNVRGCSRPLASMEVIAPNLPDTCFSAGPEARKMFVQCLIRFLGGRLTNNHIRRDVDELSFTGYQNDNENIQAIVRRFPATEAAIPQDEMAFVNLMLGRAGANRGPPALIEYTTALAEAMALIFDRLCEGATNELKAAPTALYTCLYIGLGKRGTITEEKLNSLNEAIRLETNFDVRVSNEEISTVGTNVGPFVDENNAEAVMAGLGANMENYSLRLRILMSQTAKSGLTSYWAIRDAFGRYPDFPWAEASGLIGQDFTKFRRAVGIVGNNEYYGFAKNLGDAAHTQYKSLGWLCSQLLIKNNPEEYGNLRAYRGLTNNPAKRQQLQALIDQYIPQADNAPLEEIADIIAQCRLGQDPN